MRQNKPLGETLSDSKGPPIPKDCIQVSQKSHERGQMYELQQKRGSAAIYSGSQEVRKMGSCRKEIGLSSMGAYSPFLASYGLLDVVCCQMHDGRKKAHEADDVAIKSRTSNSSAGLLSLT